MSGLQTMTLADSLRTPRVSLRAMGPALASAFFHLIDGDRSHLGATMAWVETLECVADQEERLRKAEEVRATGDAYPFAMFEAERDALMGAVGVHHIDRERRCGELGYWIATEFEGLGLASEAVSGLAQACFDAGFERLEIRCSSLNPRSSALATRCGFALVLRVEDGGDHPAGLSDQLVFARTEHTRARS